MSADEEIKSINMRNFRFIDHCFEKGGLMPDVPGAHACWYYAKCAHKALESVDEGAVYAGELDHINSINNLARAIALQYGLESPDEFLKFMDYVKAEAARCDLHWDSRIERPYLIQRVTH